MTQQWPKEIIWRGAILSYVWGLLSSPLAPVLTLGFANTILAPLLLFSSLTASISPQPTVSENFRPRGQPKAQVLLLENLVFLSQFHNPSITVRNNSSAAPGELSPSTPRSSYPTDNSGKMTIRSEISLHLPYQTANIHREDALEVNIVIQRQKTVLT